MNRLAPALLQEAKVLATEGEAAGRIEELAKQVGALAPSSPLVRAGIWEFPSSRFRGAPTGSASAGPGTWSAPARASAGAASAATYARRAPRRWRGRGQDGNHGRAAPGLMP